VKSPLRIAKRMLKPVKKPTETVNSEPRPERKLKMHSRRLSNSRYPERVESSMIDSPPS